MMKLKTYTHGESPTVNPLAFDPELCTGCNDCLEACQVDIMLPNPEQGAPPSIAFPTECWYDGSCVAACSVPGAITLNNLLMNSVHWKRKSTGEDFFL